ncbi:MAG: hypothetical protein LPJ89_02770 [Hymenobacteraceae bacterium]|nr:hypothetical protein [Hymenobacteraceae bacterium]MDX5397344.1 hypothetical protein [Hymenobacteraceae bacterium]MDX5442688.1 hypothetical protein [Hymenobacteraceae bacterium]MDX5513423.1 hypothetical protein [Hymenobacteraceae bacterium]
MKKTKRIVNILAIVYLIFALLLVFNVLNRDFFISLFNQRNLEGFYATLFFIGAFLLALELIVEALHLKAVARDRQLDEMKITELKAKLYDQRQEFRDLRTGQPDYTTDANVGQTTYPPTDDSENQPPFPNDRNRL